MPKNEYESDAADRFQVRFPDGMREELKNLAKKNKRPMNTEIVKRLEDSLAEKTSVEAALKALAEAGYEVNIKKL